MKLLIIGVSGMLGQTLFKVARQQSDMDVYGTVRRRTRNILDFLQTEEPGYLSAIWKWLLIRRFIALQTL